MRGRSLKKSLGVICCEDETDSRLTPGKEAAAFDLLFLSMSESTLSRVVTATSARDVWVVLCKLDAGKHTSTPLAYGNETHEQISQDTRMEILLMSTSAASDYLLHSTMLLEEQRPM
jgi:hypothetical protein